jgi:hypothetical protein
MGGIPESMQLFKTQRLLLFGPLYNNIKVSRVKEKQNGKTSQENQQR